MLPLTVDDLVYFLEDAINNRIDVKMDDESERTFYISNLRIPTDGGRITLYIREETPEMTAYLKEIGDDY